MQELHELVDYLSADRERIIESMKNISVQCYDLNDHRIIHDMNKAVRSHSSNCEKLRDLLNRKIVDEGEDMVEAIILEAKSLMRKITFQPWRVGKAMDRSFGGLNFEAYSIFRTIEGTAKGKHGMLPSSSSVKNSLKELNQYMDVEHFTFTQNYMDHGEVIGFDVEKMIRFIIQRYGLHDHAINGPVELAVTVDGAQLTNDIGHVTLGVKLVDPRCIDPLTGENMFADGDGFQSVYCSFPIKSFVGKETVENITANFKEEFAFFAQLRTHGLAPYKPMVISWPLDGKAAIQLLGKGGGAKVTEIFCPYCPCESKDLISLREEKCESCLNHQSCRHWKLLDEAAIAAIKLKLQTSPNSTPLASSEKRKLQSILDLEEEVAEKRLVQPDQCIIDIMHFCNRTGERIIKILLLEGARKWKSQKDYHTAVETIVNGPDFKGTHREGSAFIAGSWVYPIGKTPGDLIGDVKFRYRNLKKFLDKLELLFPTCLKERDIEKWKNFLDIYREIVSILNQRETYDELTLARFDDLVRDLGNAWIEELAGIAGMTNYFHYLFSGHLTYFMRKYGNLYR